MSHYHNAVIRMQYQRAPRVLPDESALEAYNATIEKAEDAQRRSHWRDAADHFYTAAFLSEDDPKIHALLIAKGDSCLVRAELEEPPTEAPFIADGI